MRACAFVARLLINLQATVTQFYPATRNVGVLSEGLSFVLA